MSTDCLFCKILQKQIPSKTVYEDDEVYAFHDIRPRAPVHVLIIPKVHIAKIADIGENEVPAVGKLVLAAKKIADMLNVSEKGYRLVFNNGPQAGQEVYHIHLHLLAGRDMTWPPG